MEMGLFTRFGDEKNVLEIRVGEVLHGSHSSNLRQRLQKESVNALKKASGALKEAPGVEKEVRKGLTEGF